MELEWMRRGMRWPSLARHHFAEASVASAHLPSSCTSRLSQTPGPEGTPELLSPRHRRKPSSEQPRASGSSGGWRCWCVPGTQLAGRWLGKLQSGQPGLAWAPQGSRKMLPCPTILTTLATLQGNCSAPARKWVLEPINFFHKGTQFLSLELQAEHPHRVPGIGRALLGGCTLTKKLWSPGFPSLAKYLGHLLPGFSLHQPSYLGCSQHAPAAWESPPAIEEGLSQCTVPSESTLGTVMGTLEGLRTCNTKPWLSGGLALWWKDRASHVLGYRLEF